MLEMRNLMKLFGLQGVSTHIMPLFGVRVSIYTCRSCGWLSLTGDRRKQEGQGTHGLLDEETRKLASEGLHGCFDRILITIEPVEVSRSKKYQGLACRFWIRA